MLQRFQPKSFITISFNEVWDRFCLYGLISMLVIFMTAHFHLSNESVYSLYGAFTTLVFLTPTIGGYFADKLFNHTQSVLLGMGFIALGNISLFLFTKVSIFLGLALLVIGIGLMKSNNSSLLGYLYKAGDKRKESGFTLFYMGMNFGSIIGPILYGVISISFGWRYGFIFGALGVSIMILLMLTDYRYLRESESKKETSPKPKINIYLVLAVILLSTYLIYLLFLHLELFNVVLAVFIGAVIFLIAKHYRSQGLEEKKGILLFLVLNIFSIFYFACQNQVSSSLMLFADAYLKSSGESSLIPPEVLTALEPIFVILAAPFFAKVWPVLLNKMNLKNLILLRVGLSLFMALISFIIFSFTSLLPLHHMMSFIILLLCGNLALGVGELFIGPALLSAVTYLISDKYQATFMGIWSLAIAFSGFISGYIAKTASATANKLHFKHFHLYTHIFNTVIIITLVTLMIYIAVLPLLRKLAKERVSKIS